MPYLFKALSNSNTKSAAAETGLLLIFHLILIVLLLLIAPLVPCQFLKKFKQYTDYFFFAFGYFIIIGEA